MNFSIVAQFEVNVTKSNATNTWQDIVLNETLNI